MEDDVEQEIREPRARLAFELPPELLARTEEVLAALATAEDRRAHARELIEAVLGRHGGPRPTLRRLRRSRT